MIGEFDCEIIVVFMLIVCVFDGVVLEKVCFIDGEVEVVIFDINDNVFLFNIFLIVVIVLEDVVIGDVIIMFQVDDLDEGLNSEFCYFIKSGNDVGLFIINNLIGEVKVNVLYDFD